MFLAEQMSCHSADDKEEPLAQGRSAKYYSFLQRQYARFVYVESWRKSKNAKTVVKNF